ncbi:hypothetical protein [Aeromicrobium alkaliterrae]|uniref:Uncharacterized protein n=1 Tax=Aeromicrobium alkaliterrae TaxID=302168 RepID=A0ABP4W710_9ACTN
MTISSRTRPLTRTLAGTALALGLVSSGLVSAPAHSAQQLRVHVTGSTKSACLGQITAQWRTYSAQGYTLVEHSGCYLPRGSRHWTGWVLFSR